MSIHLHISNTLFLLIRSISRRINSTDEIVIPSFVYKINVILETNFKRYTILIERRKFSL